MRTPQQILEECRDVMPFELKKCFDPYMIECMEIYAKEYHKSKVTSGLLHSVSVSFPDHYVGELNAERIKAYRFEAEKYYIEEGTVGKIFCAGANWYKSKCNER